jgi:hypothetical protein
MTIQASSAGPLCGLITTSPDLLPEAEIWVRLGVSSFRSCYGAGCVLTRSGGCLKKLTDLIFIPLVVDDHWTHLVNGALNEEHR